MISVNFTIFNITMQVILILHSLGQPYTSFLRPLREEHRLRVFEKSMGGGRKRNRKMEKTA
jgi:hypothetical protein